MNEKHPETGNEIAIFFPSPEPAESAHGQPASANVVPILARQADTDEQLIGLWLHGRNKGTQTVYSADYTQFMTFVAKPLRNVTLGDLQAFADHLQTLALKPVTQNRKLSALKSLFAFAHRIGYLALDVSRPLRLPTYRDGLADRILDEGQMQKLLALEPNPRNQALLTLLYAAGLRVSELCGLKWSDLQDRDGGGQITVFGKRSKTRTILLPLSIWNQLVSLRGDAAEQSPVFKSRKRGHLSPPQVWRIVRKAATRAKIERAVSCHWFRHAHASHALDRGAPISLVQATLGHSSISTTGRYLHARPSESSAKYLPL